MQDTSDKSVHSLHSYSRMRGDFTVASDNSFSIQPFDFVMGGEEEEELPAEVSVAGSNPPTQVVAKKISPIAEHRAHYESSDSSSTENTVKGDDDTNTFVLQQGASLVVKFYWKQVSVRNKVILPDQCILPPSLEAYMKPDHWHVFVNAAVKLTSRDHFVGTIYLSLGLLALVFGVGYFIYGLIPLEDRVFDVPMSLGAGAVLTTAGICLIIWGRSNRGGGAVFEQDLETMCENVSKQVPGLTFNLQSAKSLRVSKFMDNDLLFGVEIVANPDELDVESASTTSGEGNELDGSC